MEFMDKYDHKLIEEKWYKFWLEKKYFKAKVNKEKKPYTIVIPPPNVTGVLHMGHGLNNTIQDILIRWKRMQGYEACWIPGTDHAGIATQNVVERDLMKRTGKTREEVGREEFLKLVWEWKEKNGNTIIEQLKKLGASCDWDRERFTMDEGLSNAVKEVFIRLFEKGLIYRGEYIVNWCPRCTTALADDEVEHKEHKSYLYYIKYPLKDSDEYITVATTRPETMLGDTAVAVHPEDERYKKYIGKTVILPLAGREIPVIADKIVDREFGTGAVKVTPSHDPVDFELGKKHNLKFINILTPKGKMNENVPKKYQGMDRFACREEVIKDLKEEGYLEKIEDYTHSVGHCYRCDTVIEPYVSTQWFVKMKPLAEPGIKVVEEGKIKFYPERWKKVYLNWMYNIKDWCISRQIWWGHRIPVWYCDECGKVFADKGKPERCPKCNSTKIHQDEDVLDTWFSSALWPFSTLGWPEDTPDLKYFYPTDVLVTDPGIIFFWVARMIMMGLEFMKDVPFHDVHIHGVVLDQFGRKMSKSLGNGIDPLEVVEKFGADALRFTIIHITPSGQNLLLSMDKFNIGRHFANKIFNASRFIFMNYKNEKVTPDIKTYRLDIADKWILSKLQKLIENYTNALSNYRFQEASILIHNFIWHQFCDWYIEIAKKSIYGDDPKFKEKTFSILFYVLMYSMKLLHPIMPFISEEIYQKIPFKDAESIMISRWPEKDNSLIFEKEERGMETIKGVVTAIRNLKVVMNLQKETELEVYLSTPDKDTEKFLKEGEEIIKFLSRVKNLHIGHLTRRPEHSASGVVENVEIFMPVGELVDIEKEVKRLEKKKSDIEKELEKVRKKLKNKNFLEKAPADVIEKNREKEKSLTEEYNLLVKNIESLKN